MAESGALGGILQRVQGQDQGPMKLGAALPKQVDRLPFPTETVYPAPVPDERALNDPIEVVPPSESRESFVLKDPRTGQLQAFDSLEQLNQAEMEAEIYEEYEASRTKTPFE